MQCNTGYQQSSTVFSDSSPYGNHGTIAGSPTIDATEMTFDGSNDNVTITDDGDVNLGNQMSASMWVTPGLNLTNEVLFSKGDATANKLTFVCFVNNDGRVRLFTSVDGTINNYRSVTTSSAEVVADTKYHIVYTYDGTDALSGYKIYINGDLKTISESGSAGSSAGLSDNDANIMIGDMVTPLGTNDFEGKGADFVLWNRVLTATESELIYDNGQNNF